MQGWRRVFTVAITFVLALWPNSSAEPQLEAADAKRLPVHTSASRAEYLLGEPVRLQVTFTNVGDEELKVAEAFYEGSEPEIPVYIDGQRFYFGYLNSWSPPNGVPLKPGESWHYWLRVGFGSCGSDRSQARPERRLAFEKPGVYQIRTGFDGKPVRSYDHESNTIKVTFKEPAGVDTKVWQRLQQMDGIFARLQWYKGPSKEQVPKLLDLLDEFPQTGYAETFRSALRRYYFSQRSQVSLDERAKIRQLTGITDVYEFKDPRLDAKTEMRFDPAKIKVHDTTISLSLETLLQMLTEQTKIPFDASPYLKRRTISLWTHAVPGWGKPPVNVREYMDSEWVTDRLNAWWIKRGDGYALIREEDPPDEPKPAK